MRYNIINFICFSINLMLLLFMLYKKIKIIIQSMNDFFSNNTSARTEYSNSKIGYIQVTANILLVRLFDILCCDTVIAASSHITDKPINIKGLILEYEIGLMIRNKRISKNISS